MKDADVIIIGAGAAGLMAARELGRAGRSVIILEARNRLGGRIHTLKDPLFDTTAEAGAEFVHGNLPVTLGILKEAGLTCEPIKGEVWRHVDGRFSKEDDFIENGSLLTARLTALKQDMSIESFLDLYFRDDKYASLKESIRGYVEGYDAGDTNRASAFALRDDWTGNDHGEQYRVEGGYSQLVQYLEQQSAATGCRIYKPAIVKEISWRTGHVEISTVDGRRYTGQQVVVTVPLGVLQLAPEEKGAITFSPALPQMIVDARALGFGSVIKILLPFRQAFWKTPATQRQTGVGLQNLGWLFSGERVPTWWTQLPSASALLTGWLAGPKARELQHATDEFLSAAAIDSLVRLFALDAAALNENLPMVKVFNWTADPFTRGAYAYATMETSPAIKRLSVPVDNTVFFAGEALHDGSQMGTVEGALASGIRVARQVLER